MNGADHRQRPAADNRQIHISIQEALRTHLRQGFGAAQPAFAEASA
jgi:hypothetical protein